MMNKIFGQVVCVFVVSLFFAVFAVHAQNAPEPIKTIFDYKKDLNLTNQQEEAIKKILVDLNNDVRVTRAKLTLIDVEAGDLIRNEGDIEQIKKRLREAADLQVALKIADIVATRKINGTLSSAQLKRWREIQAAARASSK